MSDVCHTASRAPVLILDQCGHGSGDGPGLLSHKEHGGLCDLGGFLQDQEEHSQVPRQAGRLRPSLSKGAARTSILLYICSSAWRLGARENGKSTLHLTKTIRAVTWMGWSQGVTAEKQRWLMMAQLGICCSSPDAACLTSLQELDRSKKGELKSKKWSHLQTTCSYTCDH